jgi:hypothetical protein
MIVCTYLVEKLASFYPPDRPNLNQCWVRSSTRARQGGTENIRDENILQVLA